jgi:hypothetical protein
MTEGLLGKSFGRWKGKVTSQHDVASAVLRVLIDLTPLGLTGLMRHPAYQVMRHGLRGSECG